MNKLLTLILVNFVSIIICADIVPLSYATLERIDNDSIYVRIYNATDSTICLLDAFGKQPLTANDQLLYLHRFNPRTGVYALSFLPLMPFLDYSSHSGERKPEWMRFPGEPSKFYPIYKFRLIRPKDSYIVPISKASIYSKDYIEEYFPYKFAFYNQLYQSTDRVLKKHKEFKPYVGKLKIKKAKSRNKNWIMLEFAVWTTFDVLTKKYPRNEEQPYPQQSSWSFIYDHKRCNEQLHEYITISMPLILNDCE